MDRRVIKARSRDLLVPLVTLLSSLGIPPMLVSIFALVLSLYGAFLVTQGGLFWGGIWLLVSGLLDVADGALARKKGLESEFGAFIDSTFDRLSEFAYFGAIVIYFISRPLGFNLFEISIIWIALTGSILVSYARARIEGLGYSCKVGLMERPERVSLLTIGLLLGSRVLIGVMILLAVGTTITVFQRINHAYRSTRPPATDTTA
jgi:CDP-diacylglycerol--glycerol-3-phosphate 3-phosphatidyltransferase